MSRKLVHACCAIALVAGVTLAFAGTHSATGPLSSLTGASAVAGKPEELNCTLCHFNFDWNNLNTPGGAVEIVGLPDSYESGHAYPLTVRIHSDSTAAIPLRKWGFQLTAVRASDGEGCGTFVLPDPDTMQVVLGDPGPYYSREYVEHTLLGTRDGLGGTIEWSFSWTAPDPAVGKVYFFCAGNAADGNQDPGFDFIFTTSDSMDNSATPVVQTTWGSLKARYR